MKVLKENWLLPLLFLLTVGILYVNFNLLLIVVGLTWSTAMLIMIVKGRKQRLKILTSADTVVLGVGIFLELFGYIALCLYIWNEGILQVGSLVYIAYKVLYFIVFAMSRKKR